MKKFLALALAALVLTAVTACTDKPAENTDNDVDNKVEGEANTEGEGEKTDAEAEGEKTDAEAEDEKTDAEAEGEKADAAAEPETEDETAG